WLPAGGAGQMRGPRIYGARSWVSSRETSVRFRTSSAQTFASRPQQIIARGEAPRSTPCSTSSDGECTFQSVSGLNGRVSATRRLNVGAEPRVQKHVLVDPAAQLDDPLLRHQLVQPDLL